MLPWRTITIQGYLHQSEDAIVVGWETALRISLAITAGEAGSRKPFDWVGALHSYLAVFVFLRENCRGHSL
jgi:hypothetical protein